MATTEMTSRQNAEGGFNYYQDVEISQENADPNQPMRVVFPTPEDGTGSWIWNSSQPSPDPRIAQVNPADEYCGFFNGVEIWWVSNGQTKAYFKSGGMSGPPSGGMDTLTLMIYAV